MAPKRHRVGPLGDDKKDGRDDIENECDKNANAHGDCQMKLDSAKFVHRRRELSDRSAIVLVVKIPDDDVKNDAD